MRSSRAAGVSIAVLAGLFPAAAAAHPFAVSHFEAKASGDDSLTVEFRLDATSVGDLADRYDGTLVEYIDERFAVRNDGAECRRTGAAKVGASDDPTREVVHARYRCEAPLGAVEIESSVFFDEDTPHRVIGTVRCGRSVERYLFGTGERVAHADLGHMCSAGGAWNDQQYHRPQPPPGAFSKSASAPLAAPAPAARSNEASELGFWSFLRQGIHHIFGGLDHLLFVLCLVLAARRFRDLVAVVTTFTLAHSITLVAGGLGLVYVSPAIIEPLIAVSILYAAIEVGIGCGTRIGLGIVFGFGLLHGFAFSGALRGLGLPAGETVSLLFGLNIGVEIGQLIIVSVAWPLAAAVRGRPRLDRAARAVAGVTIGTIAAAWVVLRILDSV